LVNYPKRNEREAKGVDRGERWMNERKRRRASTPTLDLLGVLIEWGRGEKDGQTGYPKQRIVHRSRSRWHVT